LGCKLWLCRQPAPDRVNGDIDLQKIIKKHPQIDRLKEIYDFGIKHHWIEPRKGIREIKNKELLNGRVLREGLEYLNA
jgi:hypothetical protein